MILRGKLLKIRIKITSKERRILLYKIGVTNFLSYGGIVNSLLGRNSLFYLTTHLIWDGLATMGPHIFVIQRNLAIKQSQWSKIDFEWCDWSNAHKLALDKVEDLMSTNWSRTKCKIQ